jgi:protein SCO1/2
MRYDAAPPGTGREEGYALGGLLALLTITVAWWALALWPATDAPAWLARTRYVCFGVAENGLPDAGGWVGLIAGPLGMLVILLAGWGDGVRALFRRARSSRLVSATLSSMALVAMLLVTGAGLRVQQARMSLVLDGGVESLPPSTYPRLDRAAPALALVAQAGQVVDIASLRGRVVLVTFAYAHCETVCPVVVKHTLEAQASLAGDVRPVVFIVTLDPWRDTPSRLPGMAKSWALPARDAYVLSGPVEAVQAVLDAWEVPRERAEQSGEVVHPALVYVVDADGRLAFATNGDAGTIAALARRAE